MDVFIIVLFKVILHLHLTTCAQIKHHDVHTHTPPTPQKQGQGPSQNLLMVTIRQSFGIFLAVGW